MEGSEGWRRSGKEDKRRFGVSCNEDNLVVEISRPGEAGKRKPKDCGGRSYPLE